MVEIWKWRLEIGTTLTDWKWTTLINNSFTLWWNNVLQQKDNFGCIDMGGHIHEKYIN